MRIAGYVQNVDATERAQPKETGAIHSMLDELRQSMKQLEEKMKSIEAKGASPREEKTVRSKLEFFAITLHLP